jgi:ATP-dependent Clp protease ATP-binding subunit ClpA
MKELSAKQHAVIAVSSAIRRASIIVGLKTKPTNCKFFFAGPTSW